MRPVYIKDHCPTHWVGILSDRLVKYADTSLYSTVSMCDLGQCQRHEQRNICCCKTVVVDNIDDLMDTWRSGFLVFMDQPSLGYLNYPQLEKLFVDGPQDVSAFIEAWDPVEVNQLVKYQSRYLSELRRYVRR